MISKTLGTSQRFAKLFELAPDLAEFAQSLFPLLLSNADDFGRQSGDLFTVKHRVHPLSPRSVQDFERALVALHRVGLIVWYPDGKGGECIQIAQFDKHQTGLHKRTRSQYPKPPETSGNFPESPGTSAATELKRTELNLTELKGTEEKTDQERAELERATTDGRVITVNGAWRPASPPVSAVRGLTDGRSFRQHGQHAWCSPREGLCVPQTLHAEVLGRSQRPESEVFAWYAATIAKHDGRPIGDSMWDFWRNEIAVWLGTVTAKPATGTLGKGQQTMQAVQSVLIKRGVKP